jgi:hypothetical protein
MRPLNMVLVMEMTAGGQWAAPETVTASGKTWHFMKWSDGSTDKTKTFTADANYYITYS